MSIQTDVSPAKRASSIPFLRIFPGLVRDPLKALQKASAQADGEVTRLGLGVFRPYLITHPEHVQRILRTNEKNYVRKGMFWDPMHRLVGHGILTSGELWERSRKTFNPVFTAKKINSLVDRMTETVNEAVGELGAKVGQTVDAVDEMALIVNQTVIRVFFGDKVSEQALSRLVPAFDRAAVSLGPRMLLPWVPDAIRLPGDRSFLRSVREIDDVVYPLIREQRLLPRTGHDIVSALYDSRRADGGELSELEIRDDLVSMLGASTETSAMALTWIWPILAEYPAVAERVYEEIDRVVGRGNPADPSHLPGLVYTRRVLQELLRLYPSGWLFPRMAVAEDVVGGVTIKAGGIVLISPFLTHRMERFWDNPLEFDPDRFAGERDRQRHRYAYFPFGGGPHQCLGQHAFNLEAQLIIASILSRFRPVLENSEPVTPMIAASLRPMQRVRLRLAPV